MENKIDTSRINETNIYEGGTLSQINANDLEGNVVAIKQLINNHLVVISQSKQKDIDIQTYKSTIEYLRTSPFMAIIAGVINIIGSIFIGIGINLITQKTPPDYSWIIVIAGGLLVLVGSLTNILYPYARKWFNKNTR